ncbi:MAG: hypothetical protein AAFO83_14235, partial [Cyanobacteria bacterium J06607_13]
SNTRCSCNTDSIVESDMGKYASEVSQAARIPSMAAYQKLYDEAAADPAAFWGCALLAKTQQGGRIPAVLAIPIQSWSQTWESTPLKFRGSARQPYSG